MQARPEITVVTDVSPALTSGSLLNQKTKLSSLHGKKKLKYTDVARLGGGGGATLGRQRQADKGWNVGSVVKSTGCKTGEMAQ